jgi:hypothetical protein
MAEILWMAFRDSFADLKASAWLWIPVTFAGYYLGKRQLTIRILLLFTAAEACAISYFVSRYPHGL